MTQMNISDSPLLLLAHKNLPSLLSAMSKEYDLWAPYTVGSHVRFLPYQGDRPIDLAQIPPAHPAKSILFPNPEVLFSYRRNGNGEITLSTPPSDGKDLIAFGVRSCDVRAIAALDAVFLNRSRPDDTYQARRERLRIVGVGCTVPAENCFCDRMGGGPFDETGMDVMLIPLPDAYALKVLTERGRSLLAPFQSLLREAGGSTHKQVAALISRGSSRSTGTKVDFDALKKAVDTALDDTYWETLSSICLGCGICTFVCPVCSCFSIADAGKLWEGQRIRYWDSCMFPSFTKEASGHNPRGEIGERVKQRFLHKFYYSLENNEPPGCVGCGRCVSQCPTTIDIREIIGHFQRGEE